MLNPQKQQRYYYWIPTKFGNGIWVECVVTDMKTKYITLQQIDNGKLFKATNNLHRLEAKNKNFHLVKF